jgi:putative copper export protein
MDNFYLTLVLRWLHILSAIALMGGTIFMRFGLHPALASLPKDVVPNLKEAVRSHWAKWVMGASGLLLLSGLVNTVTTIQKYEFDKNVPYHALILVKMLLGIAIFYIASVLVGRSASAARFREKAVFWLNVNLALAVAVVLIGGFLKVSPRREKPPKTDPPAIQAAAETIFSQNA